MYELQVTLGWVKLVTTKTGPNNVYSIVWALCTVSPFFFMFCWYWLCFIIYLHSKVQNTWCEKVWCANVQQKEQGLETQMCLKPLFFSLNICPSYLSTSCIWYLRMKVYNKTLSVSMKKKGLIVHRAQIMLDALFGPVSVIASFTHPNVTCSSYIRT